MGFYIVIEKLSEDDVSVEYRFGESLSKSGVLRIHKSDGEISLIEPAADDPKQHFFIRAGGKVRQAWREGTLPDRTSWVS